MTKNKKLTLITGAVSAVSLLYIISYYLFFSDVMANTYIATYRVIYVFYAVPIFAFAFSAFLVFLILGDRKIIPPAILKPISYVLLAVVGILIIMNVLYDLGALSLSIYFANISYYFTEIFWISGIVSALGLRK